MTNKTVTMRLEDVKRQASSNQRVMVQPSVEVTARTAAERAKVGSVARRVISVHRDVLIALKDR